MKYWGRTAWGENTAWGINGQEKAIAGDARLFGKKRRTFLGSHSVIRRNQRLDEGVGGKMEG